MNATSGARSAADEARQAAAGSAAGAAREPAAGTAAGAAREPAAGLARRGGGTILDAIGDTPLVMVDGIWAKLEFLNPSGSGQLPAPPASVSAAASFASIPSSISFGQVVCAVMSC